MQNKFGDLDLLSFAKEDREIVMEAMTSLQNVLNAAFDRAAQ